MIQPDEMKLNLPMELSNGVVSTTSQVWNILTASRDGNLDRVKELVAECPELIYAQYNYTPPVHFAVREGHTDLVKFLLDQGAHDPAYKIYPFLDSLLTVAQDRNYQEISRLLEQYNNDPSLCKYRGDNGSIRMGRTDLQIKLQKAINDDDFQTSEQLLKDHPDLALDEFFFWGEGIMSMPAN